MELMDLLATEPADIAPWTYRVYERIRRQPMPDAEFRNLFERGIEVALRRRDMVGLHAVLGLAAAAKARRPDPMTSATKNNVYTFDRKLLARMTGALGDTKTISKLCGELGHVFAEFLPDIFQNETGLAIEIGYAGFDTGLKSELIANLGNGVALSTSAACRDRSSFTQRRKFEKRA